MINHQDTKTPSFWGGTPRCCVPSAQRRPKTGRDIALRCPRWRIPTVGQRHGWLSGGGRRSAPVPTNFHHSSTDLNHR